VSAKPADRTAKAANLAQVCDYLYRQTGLVYGPSKHYFAERRLAQRMNATGHRDFSAYYGRLLRDPDELEALVNAFTINETYFFREKHQLQSLSASLLPMIAAGKGAGDSIRIWSIPCSTGEEPYSIAIWLLENWGLVDAYNIDIVGSDIDTDAIQAAREGVYGERALSRLPDNLRELYFEREAADRWRIIQDLRESVRFGRVNLVDPGAGDVQGRFEVIFCRNLLIYFDERARSLAMDNIYRALAPGGFLCLGHTEALAPVGDRFIACRFKEGMAYRKPVDAT
jgi:chemotaxis protein methyltransferase CheR